MPVVSFAVSMVRFAMAVFGNFFGRGFKRVGRQLRLGAEVHDQKHRHDRLNQSNRSHDANDQQGGRALAGRGFRSGGGFSGRGHETAFLLPGFACDSTSFATLRHESIAWDAAQREVWPRYSDRSGSSGD
jgi:hypothetical protein